MSLVAIPPHEAAWRVFFDDVSSREELDERLDLLLQHSASVKSCEWSKADFLHGLPTSSFELSDLAYSQLGNYRVDLVKADGEWQRLRAEPAMVTVQVRHHVNVHPMSQCLCACCPMMCQSDIMKTVYIVLRYMFILQTGVCCPTPRRDALCLGWVACPLG